MFSTYKNLPQKYNFFAYELAIVGFFFIYLGNKTKGCPKPSNPPI